MNESIRLNLLNSNPNATDDDMRKALKMANADEFVSKLENGLDTEVGEVGNKLSGGQKQRLAIARALVRNPDVLILDEATSALDETNEKQVQKAIDSIKNSNMTKIVIAHRLSTIKEADRIISFDNGKVFKEGTYQELYDESLNDDSEDIILNSENNQNESSLPTQEEEYRRYSIHEILKAVFPNEKNKIIIILTL